MDPSPQLPRRQRLFHVTPPWVKPGEVFFVTMGCTRRGANQLARPEIFSVMTRALEHYVRASRLWADLFLVMPDHLHALLSFPADESMEKVVRDWKRYVAKQTGVVWQAGFFDHRLRNNESYEEKAHYIRQNPVRAGLVAVAQEWPYIWEASNA
jgi:REP element-mobilizing transposase RayT